MKLLRAILAFAIALLISSHANSGGVDWYYKSFSWNAFQAYFGGGPPASKLDYSRHLDAFLEQEKRDHTFNIQMTQREVELWQSFINRGLQYESLSRQDSRFADSVLSFVMSAELALDELDVEFETSPDYIHSGAFRHLSNTASTRGKALLGLFQFGRSYGSSRGRSVCNDRGVGWNCYGAYVLLSPKECSALADVLVSALHAPSFKESEFEENKYVTPLVQALIAAKNKRRGMYLYAGE